MCVGGGGGRPSSGGGQRGQHRKEWCTMKSQKGGGVGV